MLDKLNEVLREHGITIGLSNCEIFIGTWEWYEKATEEFSAGYDTAQEAYVAAASYLLENAGIEVPALNEDGDLVVEVTAS